MKAFQKLAREYAEAWTHPPLPNEAQDALAVAYEEGFVRARDMSAKLIAEVGANETAWDVVRSLSLSRLIRAIGEARIES